MSTVAPPTPYQIWYWGIGSFPAILFGVLYLGQVRLDLYARNIFDPYYQNNQEYPTLTTACVGDYLIYRSADGRCNDLNITSMGMRRNRFGRNTNVTIEQVLNQSSMLLYPNPLKLNNLMKRKDKKFVESPNINLLAAAWIQFQTHDWFLHTNDNQKPAIKIPNLDGDGTYLAFQPTMRDKDGYTFNEGTHWWDASMIYGSNAMQQRHVRTLTGGQLITANGGLKLRIDPKTGLPITAVTNNWWIGLSLMHRLFIAEHNYLANSFATMNPTWNDEQLFQHSRLVIAAILAKIHTIEWTPAILQNPVLTAGMNINWAGILNVFNYTIEQFLSLGVPLTAVPILEQVQKGVGGTRNFYGNPYAMSEEFVSVYRMHPLLPDQVRIKPIKKDTHSRHAPISFSKLTFKNAERKLKQFGIPDWINTFGYRRAGSLAFHNYPDFLTHVQMPNQGTVNVGVIDIVRDRERLGIRYNELRRQLGLQPLTSFANLSVTDDERQALEEIYDNDLELIDVFVGLMAEANWPVGYGFSTTAFYIFIIMASRRLETDRFYQESYNADVYTQFGLDYIANTNFKQILLRHVPTLANNLLNVENVFEPW